MKISELLDGICKRDLVLPEFQREFAKRVQETHAVQAAQAKSAERIEAL